LCSNEAMTEAELQQARLEKWHLSGNPVRTLDDARTFIESVGFCLMYPMRPMPLVPTFIGAWVGSEDKLPTWQHAFADSRAESATELMVRLLRQKSAYEANLFEENNNFLVSGSIFPYFYSLVGDRNPKQPPRPGSRSEYSQLACDALELMRKDGPVSKPRLQERLGGELSLAALDRALVELWSKLRITRVDYNPAEGASWDVLYRWAPDAVREGVGHSVGVALSVLISKYLDCVVAAEPAEVEAFLSNIVPRSRIKEAVNALLAARELSFVHVGNRSLIQITPAKAELPTRTVKSDPRRTPIATRPK
jgi:23S rRNA pseudouridine2605 synthase